MTKEDLIELISTREKQLSQAKSESDCWNKSKYKNSSNASISKIFVSSLEKEITDLRLQLYEFES